jgi:hypothetical protein
MSPLSTGLTPLVFVVWQYIRNILDLQTHHRCNFNGDMPCPRTCGGKCDAHIDTMQTAPTHEKKPVDIHATKKSYCFVFVSYIFAYANFSFISHFLIIIPIRITQM